MIQNKQHSLLNRANEACDILKDHVESGNTVRIISHNDADGISAAGIIAKAVQEEEGEFHTTIYSRLRDHHVGKLKNEKYKLFVFTDMGSGNLKAINNLEADVIIADHHQIVDEVELNDNVYHVNPHLYGVDGSTEISGSGTAYLTVRGMKKKHLASLALAGAFGDMQYNDGFTSFNKMILNDGLSDKSIEVHQDLKIVSKAQEPLYKSIAYTFQPPLQGLSGDLENTMALLEEMGVSYGIKFVDLAPEEKDILKEELVKINPEIFSDVYTNPKDKEGIKDIEELSRLLDACGKNKKFAIGIRLALGERGKPLDIAIDLERKYQESIVNGLEWIKKEGSNKKRNFQYIITGDKKRKGIMGTIAGISISTGILNPNLPVIGISKLSKDIKISGRTTRPVVNSGINLGKALKEAAEAFSGNGGGHNIAAGAMLKYKDMPSFLNVLDDLLEKQISE